MLRGTRLDVDNYPDIHFPSGSFHRALCVRKTAASISPPTILAMAIYLNEKLKFYSSSFEY